ncbi:hypothetical protein [Nocardia pseudovaccinii]|uniref:hypothetical protein n=1 Tax=Nocardia pseudovaccinii TaxID=189540 RepID=UPI0007A3934F|nr:hypothetical protein [Nocardia pseudovaccinii]
MSDKTSSVLGLVRHATTLRLTRIGTLVVGSLVFLYACEVSRKSDLSDVWVQVAFAAGLALTGLTTAWFEIKAADHAATRARTDIRGFLIESGDISVRARITRSGDLVFHGHDTGGTYPAYEWDWAFRATTFPDIRSALGGGKGDLLDLLEHTIPDLDRQDRYDPGAWLHNRGIPAAFRERGDTSHRITRELPVVEPEGPQRESSRESIGAQRLSSKRHNPVDQPRPSRSSRREPPGQDTPAPTRRRASDSPDPRNSANRYDEPPTRRRDQPSNTRRRANDRWEAESDPYADRTAGEHRDEPSASRGTLPNQRRAESPRDELGAPRGGRGTPAAPRWPEPSSDRWNEPPATRHREQVDYRQPTGRPGDEGSGAHRHVLSGAHPSESPRRRREPQRRQDESPDRRHRRS